MKIVAIVQARMGSTRLPGKVLRLLGNQTVLAHCTNRLKMVPLIDEIVIATTTKREDDVIADAAKELGVSVYRGSEDNVLSRYYEAALQSDADIVVRVTSDCPYIDPGVTGNVISFYLSKSVDYASNTLQRTYPRGLDTEVFSFKALKTAYKQAYSPVHYEHVTPYIYLHQDQFKIAQYTNEIKDYSFHRWTLDTTEDYELLKEIMRELHNQDHFFDWHSIIAFLENKPHLVQINSHIEQKKLGE